jgi:hypothetical protein
MYICLRMCVCEREREREREREGGREGERERGKSVEFGDCGILRVCMTLQTFEGLRIVLSADGNS